MSNQINASRDDDEETKRQDEWDRANTEDEYYRDPNKEEDHG